MDEDGFLKINCSASREVYKITCLCTDDYNMAKQREENRPLGQFSEPDGDIEENCPNDFSQFSGQGTIIENLKIFVKAAKLRGEALDHVLLHYPPGLGKTTLAHIIAKEMGSN